MNVTGIDKHQLTKIQIGTVGSLCLANRGLVIAIFNEVAYMGKHNTILSRLQLEAYHNRVDDRPIPLGGSQKITTPDGYIFPLSIINGLSYLSMKRYTQHKYDTLPHVIMTSDQVWDPRAFDSYIDPQDQSFYSANPKDYHLLPYDDYNVKGEYIGTQASTLEATQIQQLIPLHLEAPVYTHLLRVNRCMYQPSAPIIRVHQARTDLMSLPLSTGSRTHVANEQETMKLSSHTLHGCHPRSSRQHS